MLDRARRNTELRTILLGAGRVIPIQLGSACLGYFSQIAAARWMGTREFGMYAYAYTLLMLLASLACLGFDSAVLSFIPDYIRRRCWPELRGLFRFTQAVPLAAGLTVATLITVTLIALHLNSQPYAAVFLFVLWIVPLQALAQIEIGYCRSLNAPVLAYAPLFLVFRGLFVAGCFLVIWSGGRLNSWQAMQVTALAVALILAVQRTCVRSLLPREVATSRPVYERSWIKISWMMWLNAGLENCRARSHLLLLSAIKPAADVGIYYAAERTAMLVAFILAAVNALGGPRLAALYIQGQHELLQSTLGRLAHWIFWPSLGAALLLIRSARALFRLFGNEFMGSPLVILVMLFGLLVDAGAGPVGYLLNLTGHQRAVAQATAVALAVGLVLDILLIPWAAVSGAAVAATASLVLLNISLYRLTVKRLSLRPSIIDSLLSLLRSAPTPVMQQKPVSEGRKIGFHA